MTSFTVNPASLDAMATVLSGLGQQMSAMQKLPDGSAAALGGAEVEHAVEDFCSHWQHGVSLLDGSLKGLVTNLYRAAANYHATDVCIARGTRT
jgi:hypothetical protein